MSARRNDEVARDWCPYMFHKAAGSPANHKFCLIVLNQPILDTDLAMRLWESSSYRVTVDGGTSVWAKLINNSHISTDKEVPDLITGDFDSADVENIEYFKGMGAEVVETMDQDRTDFTKCLDEISKRLSVAGNTDSVDTQRYSNLKDVNTVYAYVENSGRLDQIMANIQTLFLADEYLPTCSLYLINSQSVSWLLQPGKHNIHLDHLADVHDDAGGDHKRIDLDQLHCGLIPLSGPATVTTSGLKWNLNNDELKFGALVSTSNAFSSKDVFVETDKPLLWTMDLMKI